MNTSKAVQDWELGIFAPSVSQLTKQETIALLSGSNYRWIEWRVQTREDNESNPWGKANNTLELDDLAAETTALSGLLDDFGLAVCGLQVDILENYPDAKKILVEGAQALSCDRVLLTGLNYALSESYEGQRDIYRKAVFAWLEAAEGTDLKICLENHMWTIIPSTGLLTQFLADYDPARIGVMWDPANSCWEGSEVPAMALDLVGELLEEVHFKNGGWHRQEDGGWKFDWCDITEGMVDWPSVLDLLDKAGYRGPLVVEDYRPLEPAEKLARGRAGLEEAITKIKRR